jgi:hypothetical protein
MVKNEPKSGTRLAIWLCKIVRLTKQRLRRLGVVEENIDNDSDDMDADAEPAINPLFFN